MEGKIEGTERWWRRRKQLLYVLKQNRRYWNLKEKAPDRTLYRTLWNRLWTYRKPEQLWTNWAHIDSHTETCRGIVHDVILNMLISKIYLLIHQDSHRRTHVHDVTPAINYSPERKKNESSQNVTRRKKRSLCFPRRQCLSYQTKPYTQTSSRTSFPVCTDV
jgi:hypothetical protein